MFRTHLRIAAISFPLLVVGCGDDTAPPSGPRTEHQPRPAARVSATSVERARFQLRQVGAEASFSSFDPSGCVLTSVFIVGSENAVKEGPGKPTTGPVAFVSVADIDLCTNQILRDISGFADDPLLQADRSQLSEASLQATITAFDNLSGAEVPIQVDAAWTGIGELLASSFRIRNKTPSLLENMAFKGTFRDAALSGTVVVDGETLAPGDVGFADIFRARVGQFQILRTTPQPPDTLS